MKFTSQNDSFLSDQKSVENDFLKKLNSHQTVLRIKFFGGHMYGEVKYFVPQWEDKSFETGVEDLNYLKTLNIEDVQRQLPERYYTCGRKQKPNVNGFLH